MHLVTVRDGGGIRDWIWKGSPGATAALEVVVETSDRALRHHQVHGIIPEVRNGRRTCRERNALHRQDGALHHRFQQGRPILNVRDGGRRELHREEVSFDESNSSNERTPSIPSMYLGRCTYSPVPRMVVRRVQSTATAAESRRPNEFLEPDSTNIGLVLNRLRRDPVANSSHP